jgi:DNA-binding PadR family transcriptional regulator
MTSPAPRLSGTSYAVLALLDMCGEATPYDLKQALERSVENFWPVPHTTFYAEPARLAQEGLLSEHREQGGRRRKTYALTDAGRAALASWAATPGLAPPQLREEATLKVFAGGDALALFSERREWHAAKLAELEGYLRDVETGLADDERDARWARARASLLIGVGYERSVLEAIDRFLADPAASERAALQAASGEDAAQAATGSS